MSKGDARAFLELTKRQLLSIERENIPEMNYDRETVLMTRMFYGRRNGFEFTEVEFVAAVEDYVENQIAIGAILDKDPFLILYEELVSGEGDFLLLCRGEKETDGILVCGDNLVQLVNGSVRN